MMRGTFKINNSNSLLYINRNYQNLTKVSSQIALQQQVVELEDNPLNANMGIKALNMLAKSKQYVSNLNSGVATLGFAEKYITNTRTELSKINDKLIEAASDSKNQSQRSAYAQEISEILKTLVKSANASDGTRYVFGGQQSTTPPFTIVNGRYVNYTGNNKLINTLVDKDTTMPVNVSGSDVYGSMQTTIPSRDMNPSLNMSTDNATRLADLNGGQGVPTGKIMVYYSAYPDGLEVDLSGCDTVEDVKDAIEHQTLEASKRLDPATCPWLDGTNLDWRDLQDRYVKVDLNPNKDGLSLQEFDMGEPLPAPTTLEQRRGLDYSAYQAGGTGVSPDGKPTTVFDKVDPNGKAFTNLRVDDYAQNKVAESLGLKGSAATAKGDARVDGFIHGRDLNPVLSDRTLLSDLEGYNDSTYTFTNGGKPKAINIKEKSQDTSNVFNDWNLSGLSQGDNTGPNGELYARAVNKGTVEKPEIVVELYTVPVDKASSAHLVATGSYTQKGNGGTVVFEEANSSGISGTVGIILPTTVKEATVNLQVEFAKTMQASVHVPAFVEEKNPDGSSKDVLNIASGWNIRGLDKPPAAGYDLNHPATTDLDGNVSVNYRREGNELIVELSRPAYGDQPAALIATGRLNLGDGNFVTGADGVERLNSSVSGRVEFKPEPGFEAVGGSVYIELPHGTGFSGDETVGGSVDNPTTNTYRLTEDMNTNGQTHTIRLGGAMEFQNGVTFNGSSAFQLTADTVFKAGQVFDNDVNLPGGGVLRAGLPLDRDTTIPKGTTVSVTSLEPGTVLPEGTRLSFDGSIPAGTVIPRGSYVESPAGSGFPADAMGMSVSQVNPHTGELETTTVSPSAGYDVQATFATVEDFKRAINEAGIYVNAEISDDGKGLEFTTSLAGAWLTVSEDSDSYEQMGDVNNQLTGLDLNGLIKGQNTDYNGNVHTEVIYYPPPNPPTADNKVRLVSDSGEVTEIDPGYYVRVYSDADQLNHSYANRDNSTMVAEGFIPAGQWNPAWTDNPGADGVQPFIPTEGGLDPLGLMQDLVLEERNNSGVWGRVDLDYYGAADSSAYEVTYTLTEDATFLAGQTFTEDVTLPNGSILKAGVPLAEDTLFPKDTVVTVASLVDGTALPNDTVLGRVYNFSEMDNDNITVYPGGLRPVGTLNVGIQEVDIYKPTPGVNCDYSGAFHGKVDRLDPNDPDNVTDFQVSLYKDSGRSIPTAKSDPREPAVDGKVTLYEVDKNGNFVTDAKGNRIVTGTMVVDASQLRQGESETFDIKTGGMRNGGQEREENVFSTVNDILDALQQNDVDKLNALIGTLDRDVKTMDSALADVSSRINRMNLLKERHSDDQIRYQTIFNSRVGMDDSALSGAVMDYKAATDAFQAAMQVSSTVMQMSLLQYL